MNPALFIDYDFPAEYIYPADYVHRAMAVEDGHIMHIGNVDRERFSIGKGTPLSMFNLDKLKDHGVHVDKSPYGGAGSFCGPRDVFYGFYLNRAYMHDPDRSAGDIFIESNKIIENALNTIGVRAVMGDASVVAKKDGVCLHRTGYCDVSDLDGHKLGTSVYHDDGLIVSVTGLILVSAAWTKVYNYLNVPPPEQMEPWSLMHTVDHLDLTEEVVHQVCDQVDDAIVAKRQGWEIKTMRHLVAKYKVV